MQTVHVPIPPGAMTRIRRQAMVVSNFQSCQQTFSWHASTYVTAAAWLVGNPGEYLVEIGDGHQILPYTSVQFFIGTDLPVDPATWQPWLADLYLTPSETTDSAAAAFLATQINAFYRAMVGRGFKAFESMRAVANGASIVFYLAWGMLGSGSFGGDGPMAQEAFTEGVPGVDNPLWFGIIGPKRHAFRVAPRYSGPYYGPPPIG